MMFGRFTERAQKVLALAQEEALRLGHNNIGTEHILLGLVREGEGIAAKALQALGLGSDKIQKEVESLIGRGQEMSQTIHYTPRAKKSLSFQWMRPENLAILMWEQSIFFLVLFAKVKVWLRECLTISESA